MGVVAITGWLVLHRLKRRERHTPADSTAAGCVSPCWHHCALYGARFPQGRRHPSAGFLPRIPSRPAPPPRSCRPSDLAAPPRREPLGDEGWSAISTSRKSESPASRTLGWLFSRTSDSAAGRTYLCVLRWFRWDRLDCVVCWESLHHFLGRPHLQYRCRHCRTRAVRGKASAERGSCRSVVVVEARR